GLDLPSPKGRPDKGLDLPSPKGRPDKGLDLPSPKGRPDKGLDLPSPKGKSDKGLDLPGPRGTELGQGLELDMDVPMSKQGPPPMPSMNLPRSKQESAGSAIGAALDIGELDVVAPKEGLESVGGAPLDMGFGSDAAAPLDLDELDVVEPKTPSVDPNEEQRAGVTADHASHAGSAAKPRPTRPGLLSRIDWGSKKLWIVLGGTMALMAALVVAAFVLRRHKVSPSSGPGKSQTASVASPGQVNLPKTSSLFSDTVEAYRNCLSKAYRTWKKHGKDPVAAAVGAQCCFLLELRYGVSKHSKWARRALSHARKAGTKHPELKKAVALWQVIKGRSSAKAMRLMCRKSRVEVQACFYLGWEDLWWGKFSDAMEAFRLALKRAPHHGGALYGLAFAYRGSGDTGKAIKWLRKLAKIVPKHQEGVIELARQELAREPRSALRPQSSSGMKWTRRVKRLVKAARTASVPAVEAAAQMLRAELMLARGREDDALTNYRAAAGKWLSSDIEIGYGWQLLRYGRYSEARSQFEKARQGWPWNKRAIVGLARCLVALGQADDALNLVRQAWPKWPKDAELRVLRGDINLARGKPDAAVMYYKQAVALDSKFAPAYLAWIGLQRAPAAGLVQIDQLAVQGVKDPRLMALKGRLHALEKHWGKAVAAERKALAQAPYDNDLAVTLGDTLLAAGKPEQAVVVLDQVWKRASGHRRVGQLLAKYYMGQGDIGQAIKILKKTALQRPTIAVKLSLARAYLRQGSARSVGMALKLVHALGDKHPLDATIRKTLGRAYLQANKPEEAVTHLKRALMGLPKDLAIHLWLAKAYMAIHQVGRAIGILNEALKGQPKAAAILEYRAEIAIQRGDVRAALKDLAVSLKARPSALGYTLQADCYLERQRRSKAIRSVKKAIGLDSGFARAHFLLGRILFESAKLRPAVAALRKAVEQVSGRKPYWLADAYYMLGSGYSDLHVRSEARRFLKRYLAITKGDGTRTKTRQEARRKLSRIDAP
ncbi:MAG: tetratricopeptide repeat protein, partial [Deltaproteobacteria bacterium]|nr:tetratricopeptide repeat protein [Deltaproteobacteria bacterium]